MICPDDLPARRDRAGRARRRGNDRIGKKPFPFRAFVLLWVRRADPVRPCPPDPGSPGPMVGLRISPGYPMVARFEVAYAWSFDSHVHGAPALAGALAAVTEVGV